MEPRSMKSILELGKGNAVWIEPTKFLAEPEVVASERHLPVVLDMIRSTKRGMPALIEVVADDVGDRDL